MVCSCQLRVSLINLVLLLYRSVPPVPADIKLLPPSSKIITSLLQMMRRSSPRIRCSTPLIVQLYLHLWLTTTRLSYLKRILTESMSFSYY